MELETETHIRRNNSSVDGFSFPRASSLKEVDGVFDDFDFGCVNRRPGSPPGDDPGKDSPADHLFFNGRLLPHAFPSQPVSRASSACSRDSLTASSRSNSANSRTSSSGSSSGRTSSSSDSSERRLWASQSKLASIAAAAAAAPAIKEKKRVGVNNKNKPSAAAAGTGYGMSKRWQFIAAAPALKPAAVAAAEGSRRRKAEAERKPAVINEKKAAAAAADGERGGLGRRILRSFVAACRECHSMEPTTKKKSELQ